MTSVSKLFEFDQALYDRGCSDAENGTIDDTLWSNDPSYAEGVEDSLDSVYLTKYKTES